MLLAATAFTFALGIGVLELVFGRWFRADAWSEVERMNVVPICVSQPSIVYRRFEDGWRGIPNTFTFDGRSFNGLDFRASILAINRVMAEECPRAGGHYMDLERQTFATDDYYDAAHMNARGAEKLGNCLFEEFVTQRVTAQLRRAP